MSNKIEKKNDKKDISEYSFYKNKNGEITSTSLSNRAAKGSVADAKTNYTNEEDDRFKEFVKKYV